MNKSLYISVFSISLLMINPFYGQGGEPREPVEEQIVPRETQPVYSPVGIGTQPSQAPSEQAAESSVLGQKKVETATLPPALSEPPISGESRTISITTKNTADLIKDPTKIKTIPLSDFKDFLVENPDVFETLPSATIDAMTTDQFIEYSKWLRVKAMQQPDLEADFISIATDGLAQEIDQGTIGSSLFQRLLRVLTDPNLAVFTSAGIIKLSDAAITKLKQQLLKLYIAANNSAEYASVPIRIILTAIEKFFAPPKHPITRAQAYIDLGLIEGATPEEINNAWKKLVEAFDLGTVSPLQQAVSSLKESAAAKIQGLTEALNLLLLSH